MPRRSLPFTLALALALVPAAVAVSPAAAADAPGYIRVAHLSPDTAAADISLSALSGGTTLYELTDVPYGGVSKYMTLTPGTYALAMAPSVAGTNTPVVNADIEVASGKAVTIAAVGPNASINIKTIEDDLTAPAAGTSRARVVQASTTQNSISVKTAAGVQLASNAAFGDVGSYADVAPGATTVTLTTSSGDTPADVDFADGAAQTLFVVDKASGGLTVVSVLDSSTVTETPVGGMSTGGGALAIAARSGEQTLAGGVLLAVLALALTLAGLRGRRAETARRA
ncbi:DUF4397 domain-containing protein [Naasia aerilata]|uniref:Cell wall anchor n=1 Tax=Naasia aerilata TaxID=1162966 RepID=A0ABN6XNN0_9MICO|nr:DUF4397 domain-containing protein [Naasia aerilata]BDZ46615.1 cell wall anchor [Naasia aerilata]